MVVEIIQRDIPVKGIGYIILRDCPEDRLGEGLGRGMEKLKKAGAKTVWATSLPDGEPLYPGPVGVWRLSKVHDVVRLEAKLPLPKPALKLNLRAPRKAADDSLFIGLRNRAYARVAGAVTQRETPLRVQNHRYAIAYQGEKAVGCYEVDLTEKTPELVTLAVDPDFQRQGIGRTLLRAALDGFRSPTCVTTVSSLNQPALDLLTSEGFRQTQVLNTWLEVV